MAKDPYKYFRIEAQELLDGLGRGVLELEREVRPELVRELLRFAHTLKGAARVVKQAEIGHLSHEFEDWLGAVRDETPPDTGAVGVALGLIDRMRELLTQLDAPPVAQIETLPTPSTTADGHEAIRVPIAQMDAILAGVAVSIHAVGGIRSNGAALEEAVALAEAMGDDPHGTIRTRSAAQELAALLRDAIRSFEVATDELTGELDELRVLASDLRLVPAQVLQDDLERTARDASTALGRPVGFSVRGVETKIDAYVASNLRGALRHLVQNAVAHGIEDEATRVAAGKPARGNIEVSVVRLGHRVCVRCTDDGSGFDIEAARRLAVERGVVAASDAASLGTDQLVALLTRGGLSTASSLTAIAGRGIGLDMVRATAERLKGELSVETRRGEGTTVELLVPVSLSALPALAVEVDRRTVLIPLDSVQSTVRLAPDDIVRSAGGEAISIGGVSIPFFPLQKSATQVGPQTAVILHVRGEVAAVGVDNLSGVRSVVMRNVPARAYARPIIAGAAIDDNGVPEVILAPAELVAQASAARPARDVAVKRRTHVLVVDDSLTTRMLEQSILESAGYRVTLAVSGEDAMLKAAAQAFDLFIVDVEMPGMSGFEFIEKTRARAEFQRIPAILVTSRAEPEDKARGKQVGASAYIVKNEFDQRELLAVIRTLVD